MEYDGNIIIRKDDREIKLNDTEAKSLGTFIKAKLKKKKKENSSDPSKNKLKKECLDLLRKNKSILFE